MGIYKLQRFLHRHHVQPAAEFEANLAHGAGGQKAQAGMHAD
jgi:hypothetical protein